MTRRACPFCAIAAGDAPAVGLRRIGATVVFTPLNPVVPGHRLVVPTVHVEHFAADPDVTAAVCRRAAAVARGMDAAGINLITSWGAAATQTVPHLHVHLVPRWPDDGLHLPWTGQQPAGEPVGEGERR